MKKHQTFICFDFATGGGCDYKLANSVQLKKERKVKGNRRGAGCNKTFCIYFCVFCSCLWYGIFIFVNMGLVDFNDK